MNDPARCRVCIRGCPLGRSFCGRRDGAGRLIARHVFCAIAVDSLFDKPVRGLGPDRKILSLGSWGCNLRCLGCQNHKLSWTTTGDGLGQAEMAPEAVIQMALDQGCSGIGYTYNEPAVMIEDVEEVAPLARRANLVNVLVTNSTLTVPSARRIAPWLDAVAADIKSLEDGFYERYCGAGGIKNPAERVLACVKAFHEGGCHVEVRTNVIPGGNDDEGGFSRIARWIKEYLGPDSHWHVTRFFPAHRLVHLPPTPLEILRKARAAGLAEGLTRVNIYENKGCDCAGDSAMVGPREAVPSLSGRGRKSCCH